MVTIRFDAVDQIELPHAVDGVDIELGLLSKSEVKSVDEISNSLKWDDDAYHDIVCDILAAHITTENCTGRNCQKDYVIITEKFQEFLLLNNRIQIKSDCGGTQHQKLTLNLHTIMHSVSGLNFGFMLSLTPDGINFAVPVDITLSQDLTNALHDCESEDFLVWYNPGQGVNPYLWTLVEKDTMDTTEHTHLCTEQTYWTKDQDNYVLHLKHCCHFFFPKKSLRLSPVKRFFALFKPIGDSFQQLRFTVFLVASDSTFWLNLKISCSEQPPPEVIILFSCIKKNSSDLATPRPPPPSYTKNS